jgi:hypothetical protein
VQTVLEAAVRKVALRLFWWKSNGCVTANSIHTLVSQQFLAAKRVLDPAAADKF